MRSLLVVGVALCLAMLPAVANAAGQVPDATLSQCGLSAMHQMTDAQGLNVRGSGFAWVGGNSYAYSNLPGQHSGATNAYKAKGSHMAGGASLSVAATGGALVINGGPSGFLIAGAAAGGGAVAFAK